MKLFSFIVLTYNEEIHLPRLIKSIEDLRAPLYILDSGSTDRTLTIAEEYGACVLTNKFINHPQQWNFALQNFDIKTPWTIGLDADHIVSPELKLKLNEITKVKSGIEGIFFNRKNIFKGKWIRYGGYFPKYQLKMFRTGLGYSDLTEMMDHRFVVNGETLVWENGYIIEENLKENNIAFWIEKHNRYSELVARKELKTLSESKSKKTHFLNSNNPDNKLRYYKERYSRMPLYWRAIFYFIYRYMIKLGFLDGRRGFIFHFLQALWFRLIVDIKIDELVNKNKRNFKE